jgi:hypothetical protein
MRRMSVLIGICMIAAMAITLYAQQRDIDPIMKEVGPTFGSMNKGVGGGMDKVARPVQRSFRFHEDPEAG